MDLTKEERLLTRLRDCFTAGYTLPQYCIDNGIKKPLFVTEEKFLLFSWEIYVQFKYDKRMTAYFSVLDIPTGRISFSLYPIVASLHYKNFSELNPANFDAIISLTTKEISITDKLISFVKLCSDFASKAYVEIPLLNFLQRYPYVKLLVTNFPVSLSRYEGGREFESKLLHTNVFPSFIRENLEKNDNFKTTFDKFGYTKQELCELMSMDRSQQLKVNPDGSTTLLDNNNHFVQHSDGKRITADQPEKFLNKIYIVGTCYQYGVYAPFDRTISSYLQKMLNEHHLPYRVENEGQGYWSRYQDIFYNLNKLTPAPGDIIFIYFQGFLHRNNNGIPFIDISDVFDPPHDYREIFCSKGHVNELGYEIIAKRYFDFLTENNFFRDVEFNYPLPPPHIIATEYLHNSSRAA